METIRGFFYTLTPDKILAAVETAGVRCTGRLLQLGSFENRVFEVEIELVGENENVKSRADHYRIVKFYRPERWSLGQIEEEHDFLRELQAEDIPVVAPVVLTSGSSIGVLPYAEGSSMYFAVFPKVQGRRPEELKDQELKMLGRLLARMHVIGKRKPAVHRKILSLETFGKESLEFLKLGHFIPSVFEDRLSAMVQEICTRAQPFFSEATVQRIHGDCHLGNVLQGPDGFFFLDFDDMVTGPVVQDVWMLCGGRDDEGKRQLQKFLDGYEEFSSFEEESLRLIEPLRALRYIHYSAWIARRWEDPIFPRTFPHFKAQDYWINQMQDLQEVLDLISQ